MEDRSFMYDERKMEVVSADPGVKIVVRLTSGGYSEYREFGYVIEIEGKIYCFRAQYDYTRDVFGNIKKVDGTGQPEGVAWRGVRLHGSVVLPGTGQVFRSEIVGDPIEYRKLAGIVINILSLDRFIRGNPPVRLITFDLGEAYKPNQIEVA